MKAYGLTEAPAFERIIIPTVGLPWYRKYMAAFTRPRIRMIRDFIAPRPLGGHILIPRGFESDGGSVPLFGLWCMMAVGVVVGGWFEWVALFALLLGLACNAFGLMLASYLVHDFAIKYKAIILINCNTGERTLVPIDSVSDCNTLMRRVNFAVNDMIGLGLVAHAAVTIGAWWAWRKHRKADRTGVNDIPETWISSSSACH